MKLARQNPRIGAIVNVNISDDDDDEPPPIFLTRNLSLLFHSEWKKERAHTNNLLIR
jgi:hypothetical protein